MPLLEGERKRESKSGENGNKGLGLGFCCSLSVSLSLSMFSLTRIVWEREGVNVNESFSKFWGRSVG